MYNPNKTIGLFYTNVHENQIFYFVERIKVQEFCRQSRLISRVTQTCKFYAQGCMHTNELSAQIAIGDRYDPMMSAY